MVDYRIRAALGTGLAEPILLEISGEEVSRLEGLTVEEALHFLIRKSDGQPTARIIRSILLSSKHYEVQVNGRDANPREDRIKAFLKGPGGGSGSPVEELNIKVTERQRGGRGD